MDKKYTTVTIPITLAEKLKERIKGTGFSSLSSYVTYILRQIVSSTKKKDDKEAFSEEDEKKVKERLRGLGYIE